ncbi:MAG: hypothetical protein GFH27_549321n148 [Chloroflexi bacterium AL-W]|nr:hypothetical protein [Chloroflexi bacterium AL-N1]NOK65025.1 hypothetical protein [Chloroflexi bacterium AL-N10]NOK76795.1 hypothetical protein [Chloroflexi bacterium AL-N5]NOK84687.1 hypothetical protein [Chloroflexi bacterium AL-W]NOK86488.1 hypothetical protein [Chloroflexi bacterium AL-N15]
MRRPPVETILYEQMWSQLWGQDYTAEGVARWVPGRLCPQPNELIGWLVVLMGEVCVDRGAWNTRPTTIAS